MELIEEWSKGIEKVKAMIRYPTTLKAPQQAVDALPVPTGKSATGRGKSWRERAEERT